VAAARNRLAEHEPFDIERTDANVEVGQDRFFGLRRLECRKPPQGRARYRQPVDVEPVRGQVQQRRPVELGGRSAKEQSLGIVQPHVVQHRLAVQRPVDPADLDFQAGRGRHLLDPVDQRAMPRIGIDRHERDRRQRHQRDDDAEQPGKQRAQPPAASHGGRRLVAIRTCRHQNAWPSET
jgi:hypothetical protein